MKTSLVLAFALMSLLAACGGSSKPDTTTPPPDPTPTETAPTPTAETPPTPAPTPTPTEAEKPPEPVPPPQPAKVLVLVDAQGVGLGGHDPVAYAKDKKAVAGKADQTASHGGATYRFASADNKTAFEGAPEKHAPRYGGYCAFAASQNRLSKSDPKVFLVHEGELLMFTNKDFLSRFQKDPAGHKQKADANWPGLVEQHGKTP